MDTLTRKQIEQMPAGLLMDEQVSLRVMQWTKFQHAGHWFWQDADKKAVCVARNGGIRDGYTPAFSADIVAAWPLLAGKGWLLYENLWNDANRWFVFEDVRDLEDWRPLGYGETAPIAICKAALLAAASPAPPVSPAPAVPAVL